MSKKPSAEASEHAEVSRLPDLPIDIDIESMLQSDVLWDLFEMCVKLGLRYNDSPTVETLRGRILDHIKGNYRLPTKAVPTIFTTAKAVFHDFTNKKNMVVQIVENVRKFVTSNSVLPLLGELQISSSSNVWLKPFDFLDITDSTKRKPMLLIAGSTSSGKSTFANVLLGEEILPTSYNAATSVLCEIKYGESKRAVLHMEQDGNKKKQRIDLDLMKDDDRQKFEKMTSPNREDQLDSAKANSWYCTIVEVFLPIDFLKDVTLIDSPGVTEDDEADSSARAITEKCQRDMACGFIYVMNSSNSAEEAAQVGGLLRAIVGRTNDTVPPPESAIFIANKWDILEQQAPEELDSFQRRVVHGIQSRWSGFKPRQLIPMNSKRAAQAQEFGYMTEDMKKFSQIMESMLPVGMHYMLEKILRRPYQLMDYIDQVLENALRELRMPLEDRQKKRGQDWEKFLSFEKSITTGKFAAAREMLEREISAMASSLAAYLTSEEGYKAALKWKKDSLKDSERKYFDERNVKDLVSQRFHEAICNFPQFQSVCQWANSELVAYVSEALKELNILKADLGAVKTLPIDQDDSEFATSEARTTKAFPLFLAINLVALPVIKLIKFFKTRSFKSAVESGYKELVSTALAEENAMLTKTTSSLLKVLCQPVGFVLEELPTKLESLREELKARDNQEKSGIPRYEDVLHQCRVVKGNISKFLLELNVHTFKEADITWPDPKVPVATGNFTSVYQVILPNKVTAALKKTKGEVTENNSEDFLKTLQNCRQFKSCRNLVKFLGSVRTSEEPLELGLLFEWCGGGNLAEMISDGNGFPPHNTKGFAEGKRIVREMLLGIAFLHSKGIVHKDLKPENIMMTSDKIVKIGDMGLAKPVSQVNGALCGTLLYMAPEILREFPYSLSADIYSVGIMLWEIWNFSRAYAEDDLNLHSFDSFRDGVYSGDVRPSQGRFAAVDTDPKSQTRVIAWADITKRCWLSSSDERPTAEKALAEINKIQ